MGLGRLRALAGLVMVVTMLAGGLWQPASAQDETQPKPDGPGAGRDADGHGLRDGDAGGRRPADGDGAAEHGCDAGGRRPAAGAGHARRRDALRGRRGGYAWSTVPALADTRTHDRPDASPLAGRGVRRFGEATIWRATTSYQVTTA